MLCLYHHLSFKVYEKKTDQNISINGQHLEHCDIKYPWVNNLLVYRAKGDKARSQYKWNKLCAYLNNSYFN